MTQEIAAHLEDNLPHFVKLYDETFNRDLDDKEQADYDLMKEQYSCTNIIYRMLWLSRISRLDLSLSVSILSKHCMGPPCYDAYRAIRLVLQYLLGTIELGISFKASGNKKPIYYVDTNHPLGRPRMDLLVRLAGGPIEWHSKLAPVTSTSSIESEIYGAHVGLTKGKIVHEDFKHVMVSKESELIDLKGGDDACTLILDKSRNDLKTVQKHTCIGNRLFRSMEWCSPHSDQRIATMTRVDTTENLADFFTKPQSKNLFISMRNVIMGMVDELANPSGE